MSELKNNGRTIQTVRDNWQTTARGTNSDEYQIYLACADNGKGIDIATGKPLKTYDEWLAA